jgi:hypothetical protein
MSNALAYDMMLYYEGYDPKALQKEADRKLTFERERL